MPETNFDSGTRTNWPGAKYNYTRVQGTLGTSAATLFENDREGICIIEGGIITEYSNNARTFTLRVVKSADTPGATNDIFHTIDLEASEAFILPFPIVLLDGDYIQGLANAATSVNYYFAIRREV